MENSLSASLSDSISERSSLLAAELLEVGLDSVLENGVLKEIPILSTVVNLYKIGNAIKERHYVKKLAAFVAELNKGIVDEEKREYYKSVINSDPKRRNKELEYIMLFVDRFIQIEKAKFLAKLYLAYLDNRISWNGFLKVSEIIDSLLLEDLYELRKGDWLVVEDVWMSDNLFRLISQGLVRLDTSRPASFYGGTKRYTVSSFGTDLLFLLY